MISTKKYIFKSDGVVFSNHCTLKYILCTGAFLYAPYSLLLISNKFWMGKGESGGEARGLSWRGRIKRVEGWTGGGSGGVRGYFMHWRGWWGWGNNAVMLFALFTSLVNLWLTYVYAHIGMGYAHVR
jgi:hypothetical protein